MTSCLLCQRPPHVRAVFFAADQAAVLSPRDKLRGVAFTLCRRCFRQGPSARARAERLILQTFAQLAAERN